MKDFFDLLLEKGAKGLESGLCPEGFVLESVSYEDCSKCGNVECESHAINTGVPFLFGYGFAVGNC